MLYLWQAAAARAAPVAGRDARRGDGRRAALQRQLAHWCATCWCGCCCCSARAAIQSLLPIVVRGPLEWSSGGYGILLGCFGIGATISAILRPHIVLFLHPTLHGRRSVVLAGTLVVQGFVHDRVAVGVALSAGGFMWSLAAAATTSPPSRRCRPGCGRAAWRSTRFVLAGSIAIGSALWGFAANWNLGLAHLIAAIVMALSPLAALRWPLTWESEFDMTMLPGDEPERDQHPAPDDGPVLVTIAYRVPLDELDEFGALMEYIEAIAAARAATSGRCSATSPTRRASSRRSSCRRGPSTSVSTTVTPRAPTTSCGASGGSSNRPGSALPRRPPATGRWHSATCSRRDDVDRHRRRGPLTGGCGSDEFVTTARRVLAFVSTAR